MAPKRPGSEQQAEAGVFQQVIAHQCFAHEPAQPRRAQSDFIGRIELARLSTQREDQAAAAIARVGLLLLKRLDQLSLERKGDK